MAQKQQRGLGRGLDAIFLDNETEIGANGGQSAPVMLRLSDIEPRAGQPRKSFDPEALASLADSIAANGLIQPMIVRQLENGMYQIIAGERRWRACKLAGLTEASAIVMNIDDRTASELALIENLQREDLNPIEEAAAYRSLITEYNMTQDEISKRIGKSRSAVANALRLLDLPDAIVKLISDGKISAGHARALLSLHRTSDMERAAKTITDKEMSVRAAEELIKRLNAIYDAEQAQPEQPTPEVKVDYTAELERTLSSQLGRRVHINAANARKPKTITLEYTDNEDLDAIIKLLTNQ